MAGAQSRREAAQHLVPGPVRVFLGAGVPVPPGGVREHGDLTGSWGGEGGTGLEKGTGVQVETGVGWGERDGRTDSDDALYAVQHQAFVRTGSSSVSAVRLPQGGDAASLPCSLLFCY